MRSFEQVVRPFQRPTAVQPRRLVASSEKVEVEPVLACWGKSGTLPEAHQIDEIDPTGLSFTVVTCDDKYTEVGRKTDQIHIEQVLPNGTRNPDNYVDLDRPYQVTMRKESETEPDKNQTQVWSTSLATAGYRTVGFDNKSCQSKYNFNRNL